MFSLIAATMLDNDALSDVTKCFIRTTNGKCVSKLGFHNIKDLNSEASDWFISIFGFNPEINPSIKLKTSIPQLIQNEKRTRFKVKRYIPESKLKNKNRKKKESKFNMEKHQIQNKKRFQSYVESSEIHIEEFCFTEYWLMDNTSSEFHIANSYLNIIK